jgi:glycosidase
MAKHILTLLLASIHLLSFCQSYKIEPPFWWADMDEPEFQLMVYAPNVAAKDVKINAADIQLLGAYKTDNPNYVFINMNISKAKAQKFEIELILNGKVDKIAYELKQRAENSRNRKGFNSRDALYLITPDRFANGNEKNDNIKGYPDKLDRTNDYGRHGGDIAGIVSHLDYISNMGFTAVWLSPVLENNMPKASYHGYAITDFYKVDPRFGTNEEYKAMVSAANAKGIKVIMDQILNHCGSHHWWMNDLPSKDWITGTLDSLTITNHRHSITLDPYASKTDTKRFKEGWFVDEMPDLNLANYQTFKYLVQNSIWWIEYSGIAGIRMDTYPYSDTEGLDHWSCAIMAEYPNFNIVGEEWTTNPVLASYWQQNSKIGNHHSCLPSVMDFPLQNALANSLTQEGGWDSKMMPLYEMLANDVLYANTNNVVIFGDNHDMDRFYTQVGKDLSKFKMGLAILYTMRGTPQIYYGTEALFANKKRGDHGQIRKEMDGGWSDHRVNIFTQKNLTTDQLEAQRYMKALGQFRKTNTTLHTGKLLHFTPADNVYTYFRYTETEVVMVIINRNATGVKVNLAKYDEVIQNKGSMKRFDEESYNKKPSLVEIRENGVEIFVLR